MGRKVRKATGRKLRRRKSSLLYAFYKTLLNKPINKNENKVCGRLAICGRALLLIGSAGQVDALRCDVRSSPDVVLFLCVRATQLPALE